jgi:hypothetical protein
MKKQLLILALAGLAFTACKKDDDAPKNSQLIKKITEVNDGDTIITNVSYDNSKRISIIKTNEGEETKLTYNSNNLTVVEISDGDDKTKLEITYNGGKPVTAVFSMYEDNVFINKYKYTYTLNAANQITEVLMKDSTNANVIGKAVFTYANGNVTKVQSYAGANLFSTLELTYGTKKSMFYNARVNYVLDPFLAQAFSANEVTKEKFTIGTIVNETTNTYTYDASGFPLTANVSEKELPNGTPETSTLKFEY